MHKNRLAAIEIYQAKDNKKTVKFTTIIKERTMYCSKNKVLVTTMSQTTTPIAIHTAVSRFLLLYSVTIS